MEQRQMSHSTSLRAPVQAASPVAAGKTLLWGWINDVGRWLERRRQWQALRDLDDRLLADVGISPEDAFRTAGRPLQCETLLVPESGQRS
jgi:uncharacterized protein YjiS (DUF1127 family)